MLEVATLLLTPGAQPVCRGVGQSAAEQGLGGPQADQRSPRITFTLNRSLRRASSALKLHFTSSYMAETATSPDNPRRSPQGAGGSPPGAAVAPSYKLTEIKGPVKGLEFLILLE